MKEKPILFKAPMVRAILNGTKMQTRRIINPQPPEHIDRLHGNALRKRFPYPLEDDNGNPCGKGFQDDNNQFYRPVGLAGDRLWVKETWKTYASLDSVKPSNIARGAGIEYAAGGTSLHGHQTLHGMSKKWRSPLFMMDWMSRITLEIVKVRVERLQDISEEDAKAEGVQKITAGNYTFDLGNLRSCGDARTAYIDLWNHINGPGSWDKNPWVWVIEFNLCPSVKICG